MKKGAFIATGLPSGKLSLCNSSRKSYLGKLMDDITERCAGLKLSRKEDAEVEINMPRLENGPVLIGKFCTKRRINLESVARVLKTVWKAENGFEVNDLGDNKVMFLFHTMEDMDRVLLLSPWSFDKYLVILHKMEHGEAVKDAKFDKSPFWIQIHGLPTMCQTKEVGESIGATLGKVEKVDAIGKGFCLGNYLRIRVRLDITMPLCRGRKVRLGDQGLKWVDLKYERLPIFCYLCGRVDHDEKECMQGLRSNSTLSPDEKQFGPWLRATQDRYQKPQTITTEKTGEISTGRKESGLPGIRLGREKEAERTETPVEKENPGKEVGVGIPRADVVRVGDLTTHINLKSPDIQQALSFEQQIRDIDAAINGEGIDVHSEPRKEEIVTEKEITLSLTDIARVKKERAITNGPVQEAQYQMPIIKVQSPTSMHGKLQETNVGLSNIGPNFSLGLASPKKPKSHNTRKAKGSESKKFKENRGPMGKERAADWLRKQAQGDDMSMETKMEIDHSEVGGKRKVRSPLLELVNNEGNGKRIRVEGEVKELGKLLAQHLGSAEAANQPRRVQ